LLGAASGNSTKLASIGADTAVSILGELRKSPNFHMTASQMMTARGTGHQSLISFARKSGSLAASLMLDRNQKAAGAGSPCLQHRLHHDALWRDIIR